MSDLHSESENYYDSVASHYDTYYHDGVSQAEDLIIKAHLQNVIKPQSRVLDCGCGTGLAVALLSDVPCYYTGIDISKNMLSVAKKKYPDKTFIHGDISSMPSLSAGTFDNIISLNGSFSHVINYPDAINEFFRLLKPGGEAFVMVYGRFSLKRILRGAFFKRRGRYNIRNCTSPKAMSSPAIFWSAQSLRKSFHSFSEVNVSGLNVTADFFKRRHDVNEALRHLKKELSYPALLQQFAHALILKATK